MKKLVFLVLIASLQSGFASEKDSIKLKLEAYKTVKLTADLSKLSILEREGIKQLIMAAEKMDQIFRLQAYAGNLAADTIMNPDVIKYLEINYGPWDRLDNNKPFIKGIGPKPLGANFYPADMRQSEYDSLKDPEKADPYTIIVREEGQLKVIPYNQAYEQLLFEASLALKEAANFFSDSSFKVYLKARSEALVNNSYDASDRIWLDMKDNRFDIIIGPIENYEDKLYGNKTAYEAYVLVKDVEWSKKLDKYVQYLPELQKNLPVDPRYKNETAGSSSQLNAYDIIYYAGDCNSGSKTIAVNLPNDEKLQLEKGTRRSQFKNTIQYKFDHIMLPIAESMVAPEQRKHVTFNAFFSNTMFHEVAHGLGIKNTINGKGTVREALGADYSALEEGKADILGLYMITQLMEKKVLTEGELMDYYVTFMAGIFRSVRFGAASAHGRANMIRFNYFKEKGAFIRDAKTGYYRVDMKQMKEAMTSLSALILKLQGDGDLEGVKQLIEEKGSIQPELQKDLDKLKSKNIPVDIVFEQGVEVLNLNQAPTEDPGQMKH
ncbi:MAG: Zn-dependent hydrolase [Bacteroidia bacterium]